MRKITFIFLLLLAVFGSYIKGQASHLVGGEIFYTSIAPNVYQATASFYYDCRTTIPPASIQFNLRAPGCNVVSTFPSDKLDISGKSLNPYCTAIGNSCSSNALMNLRMVTYSATFSLSAAQRQCNDWLLSVKDCYRSGFVNIPDADKTCIYLEAYINANAPGNMLSSPKFLPPTDLFVNLNEEASISNLTENYTTNAPDSLVYELVRGQEDHNIPLNYVSPFSHSQPLPASAPVKISPNTGMLTFRPIVFHPSANPETNAYLFTIQVTAYQKFNGRMTRVSTSQRSLPVFVADNTTNASPQIVDVLLNGLPVLPNSITQVWAGSNVTFTYETSDANASDDLITTLDLPAIPGFDFTAKGGSRPTGNITWQAPAVGTGQVQYFSVTVKDNACSVQGVNTQVFGLKVVGNALGVKDEFKNSGFSAYPNPFSGEISFKSDGFRKHDQIVICNLLGQEIDRITIGPLNIGSEPVKWQKASAFASGTYMAKLMSGGTVLKTIKITKVQ